MTNTTATITIATLRGQSKVTVANKARSTRNKHSSPHLPTSPTQVEAVAQEVGSPYPRTTIMAIVQPCRISNTKSHRVISINNRNNITLRASQHQELEDLMQPVYTAATELQITWARSELGSARRDRNLCSPSIVTKKRKKMTTETGIRSGTVQSDLEVREVVEEAICGKVMMGWEGLFHRLFCDMIWRSLT